jgi:hypothetical protein
MITIGQFLGSILIAFFVECIFTKGKPKFNGFSWAFFGSILGQFVVNAVVA